eukprot:5817933-Amphidinium_carterae.1
MRGLLLETISFGILKSTYKVGCTCFASSDKDSNSQLLCTDGRERERVQSTFFRLTLAGKQMTVFLRVFGFLG